MRSWRRKLGVVGILAVLITAVFGSYGAAFADESPEMNDIVIGVWNASGQCVSATYDVSVNYYNQHSLPNEWYASWPAASLEAGAVTIRSDAIWSLVNPDTYRNACTGGQVWINLDTAQINFIYGSATYTSTNSAIDPTTDAHIEEGNSALSWFSFNSCMQDETDTLANQGEGWGTILDNIYVQGAGGCGVSKFSSITGVTSDSNYS
jgi:hypothetical protein